LIKRIICLVVLLDVGLVIDCLNAVLHKVIYHQFQLLIFIHCALCRFET
jgi:hypothetical protein